ncbi:MAG: hypothetical protein RL518_166 [Pseudomonadota bacterium]
MPASNVHPNLHRFPGAISSAGAFVLFASTIAALTVSLCCFVRGIALLPQGPAVAIAEVTKSVANSGSLTPQYFHDVRRDAAALGNATHSDVWQDVFALDQHGELRPKHSLLSSLFAVPFYWLFGNAGFWILQQVLFLGLLGSTYTLVKRSTGLALPWSTLVSTLLLTQSIFYCYSFSYDLHGCAVLMGGLCIMSVCPTLGAAIMTLSIFVRPTYILLILPLTFGTMRFDDKKRCGKVALGVGLVLVLFGLFNYYMWGNPLLTAYSRLPGFRNGEMVLSPTSIGFDLSVFLSRWEEKVFSSRGLLPYNLSVVALPLVVVSLWRARDRFRWTCFLSATAYTLYIFSYPMWDTTSNGNRFLMPAIYLYLLCFIPVIGGAELRYLHGESPKKS